MLCHAVPNCLMKIRTYVSNGDNRVRTGGLRLARAALSQLSYIPMKKLAVPAYHLNRITAGVERQVLPRDLGILDRSSILT